MFVWASHWTIGLFLCVSTGTGQARECDVSAGFALTKQSLQAKRYEAAAAILDRLKNCDNLSTLQRFEMAWMYGRARHFREANQLFRSVPDDIPDRASHRYAVALSAFELSDYRAAIEELTSSAAEGALNPDSANLLGVSYSKLGLYPEAESTLTREIARNPNDVAAHLNLVTLYADQGRFTEAGETASKAASRFPDSPKVFVARGAVNTLTGRLDDAYKDFEEAVNLAPNSADPRFLLALTRYKQGRFAGAIGSLRLAIRANIADSDLHYLLAECLLRLDGSNRSAPMAELNRAIELNENSVSARTLRGKLLLQADHAKEAVVDLELALRADPTSPSASYNLAHAYQKVGRIAESENLFKRLRNRNSDSLGEASQRKLSQALGGGEPQE